MEALAHFAWMNPDRSLIEQHLAKKIRVGVAGLHAQAIYAPESLCKNARSALSESMFLWRGHGHFRKLTEDELLDFSFAKQDIEWALAWASAKLGAGPRMYQYLRRREREVRKRLSMPTNRRAADRLVAAVADWCNQGGPANAKLGPTGGYSIFPAARVVDALNGHS